MADTITRVYGNYENALAAVGQLKQHRFTDFEINVVTYLGGQQTGGNVSAAEFNELVDAIAAGFVRKADAAIYTLSVARGGTLVSVRAPFGTGGRAAAILDNFNPIETGVRLPEYKRLQPWDEAAPASSFLILAHPGVPGQFRAAIRDFRPAAALQAGQDNVFGTAHSGGAGEGGFVRYIVRPSGGPEEFSCCFGLARPAVGNPRQGVAVLAAAHPPAVER
jgi:hypothetical protein